MNNDVVEFIRWASHFSVLFPLVVYLTRFPRSPIQNHIVGVVITISGVTDTISVYNHSPILFNLYQLCTFTLTTWFFYVLVYKKKSEFIALISIGIYLSVLIFSIMQYGLYENYSNLWLTGAVITLVNAVVYIFNIPMMVIDRYFDSNLLSNMIFNASMFVFFFVATMIYFLFDPVSKLEDLNDVKAFWTIHNAFNVLKNLGFALAFFYTGKRSVYMTVEQLERIAKHIEKEKYGT